MRTHHLATPRSGACDVAPGRSIACIKLLFGSWILSFCARRWRCTPRCQCTRSCPCTSNRLLQEDIAKIRDVMDEFLSKYPLCFGYWHQYASAEDKHGDRAKEIYEQGIQSTPYSIDLWIYYIDWLKEQDSTTPDAVRMCESCCALSCCALSCCPACAVCTSHHPAMLPPVHVYERVPHKTSRMNRVVVLSVSGQSIQASPSFAQTADCLGVLSSTWVSTGMPTKYLTNGSHTRNSMERRHRLPMYTLRQWQRLRKTTRT